MDLCETLNKGSRQVFVSFINISLWNKETDRNPTKMSRLMDFLFATLYRVAEILVANCSLTDGTRRDGFLQCVLPSFGSLKFRAMNTCCRGSIWLLFGCLAGRISGILKNYTEVVTKGVFRTYCEFLLKGTFLF